MIELNNISKRYTKKAEMYNALNNISLKIGKGDFFSVIGPSGAGKSTLLYVIGGLVHPDSGTMMYNGRDIYSLSDRDANQYRKNHLGFMFQQFHLMPWLNVGENIRLTCSDKIQQEKIDQYLEKCSLTGMRKKYPSELSVGEKQRTAFIRAIISNPEILLADEPTGNLDAVNSEILLSLVKEYNQNGGTVVLVSHDPGISRYTDRSIVVEKGHLLN
jgi:ABC-type lipoprotein export system ATPase subunit